MEQLLIRKMEIRDNEAVAALSLELGHTCTAETVQTCIQYILDQTDDVVIIAEMCGKVVGFIHGTRHALLYAKPMINMIAFIVGNGYRGQGIGSAMLKNFEACAREKGYAGIRLGCRTDRMDSHRFYEGKGYKNSKSQKIFVKLF